MHVNVLDLPIACKQILEKLKSISLSMNNIKNQKLLELIETSDFSFKLF